MHGGGNGRTFCPLWDNELSPAPGCRAGSDGKYQLPTTEIRFLLHVVHCWEGLVAEVSWLFPASKCEDKGENTSQTKPVFSHCLSGCFEFNRCQKTKQISRLGSNHLHSWKEILLPGCDPSWRAKPCTPILPRCIPRHLCGTGSAATTHPSLPGSGTLVPRGVTWTQILGQGWEHFFAATGAGPGRPAATRQTSQSLSMLGKSIPNAAWFHKNQEHGSGSCVFPSASFPSFPKLSFPRDTPGLAFISV